MSSSRCFLRRLTPLVSISAFENYERPVNGTFFLSSQYAFSDWMLAFRVVIPLYMVLALSQFITYLLILIVGEKENKIKEGMKIMGLKDSVFW